MGNSECNFFKCVFAGKQTEREKLFDGATSDTKPRARTVEEIKAKYKNQDIAEVTAEARNKLIERQEKLEVRLTTCLCLCYH